jgi:hypothetical protein
MEYFEIDSEKKTWAVATLRDVQAQGKALGAQLDAADAALPPEQRERARAERRERLARWTKLQKDTRFEQTEFQGIVAEQMCDGYQELVGGKVVAEGCYIPWRKETIRKEDVAAVTRFAEFLNTALSNVDAAQASDLRDGPLGRLRRSPGFPALRYDIAPDGKSGVQLRLVSFLRTTVRPESFRPPPDYAKVDRPAAVAEPALRTVQDGAQRAR